jgi:dUTP pyrophosphatase
MKLKVRVKKLHSSALLPIYATPGAACFDLHAVDAGYIDEHNGKTGLAFEVPDDHVMLVYSRSGHGYKHGVRLVNCVGVIDSDYRNEVCVKLHQDDSRRPAMFIAAGDRIAQGMIIPLERIEFEEASELSTTERSGGFGSTGR